MPLPANGDHRRAGDERGIIESMPCGFSLPIGHQRSKHFLIGAAIAQQRLKIEE